MPTKLLSRNKSLISYFSFSIATSALGFVASQAMIRLMAPAEFARVSLFLSVQFIAIPLVSFAADGLIAINKTRLSNIAYEHFRRSYVTFSYILFLLIQPTLILLFRIGLFSDPLFAITPLFGLIRFLITMASTEYVMEEKAVHYGLVSFSTSLISLVLTCLLLIVFSGLAEYRIVALIVSDILFLFVRYRGRLRLLWTFTFDKAVFKEITTFGFPILLSVAPAWAINESDKFVVAKIADMTSLGYYAAAWSIGGIMITFNTAMLNAVVPKLYRALSDRPYATKDIIKQYMVKYLLATAMFGAGVAFTYWSVADWLLPQKYVAARHVVYVIILFSLGRAIYAILGAANAFFKMSRERLVAFCIGAAVSVSSSILGLKYIGLVGAATAAGLGYITISTFLWMQLKTVSIEHPASLSL